jgi:hypothetical protein
MFTTPRRPKISYKNNTFTSEQPRPTKEREFHRETRTLFIDYVVNRAQQE